jgi:hypothetical protein
MGSEPRSIKDVVRSVRDDPNEQVLVVRCSNGKLGVVHNGTLMQSLEWPAEQLDECVAFAERFARTALHGQEQDSKSAGPANSS